MQRILRVLKHKLLFTFASTRYRQINKHTYAHFPPLVYSQFFGHKSNFFKEFRILFILACFWQQAASPTTQLPLPVHISVLLAAPLQLVCH